MERFQHIIRFSHFSHWHTEEWYITQAFNTSQPIGFSMITGSLTPMIGLNPTFTIIDYDEEYMIPINTYTYFFDLKDANEKYSADKTTKPVWKIHHDMKS